MFVNLINIEVVVYYVVVVKLFEFWYVFLVLIVNVYIILFSYFCFK